MRNLKVFFGTVIRAAPLLHAGELVKIDWNTKEVESVVIIRPKNPDILYDPNLRGNTRGCRGIEFIEEQIIAANYHTLEFYTENFEYVKSLSNDLMVDNHEIYLTGKNNILVASTGIDSLLNIDLTTGKLVKAYYPREMEFFQKTFNLEPMDFDKNADNRTIFVDKNVTKHPSHVHLNVGRKWNGDIYALFNSFGAVVNLTKEEVVIQNDDLIGAHNMVFTEEGICFVNNTKDVSIYIIDIKNKEFIKKIDIRDFKWSKAVEKDLKKVDPMQKPSQKFYRFLARSKFFTKVKRKLLPNKHFLKYNTRVAKSFFVRGLDIIEDYIFVGISPASILCINWKTNELVDVYKYTDDIKVAVHGLRVKQE